MRFRKMSFWKIEKISQKKVEVNIQVKIETIHTYQHYVYDIDRLLKRKNP